MSSSVERQLARRLGVSEDEARSALAALAHDVRRRLAQRGRAEIDGVGTLVHDDSGVTFELAPSLVAMVEERNAGPGTVAVAGPGTSPFALPREEAPPPEDAAPAPEETAGATAPDAEIVEDEGRDMTPAEASDEPTARESEPAEPDVVAIEELADEPAAGADEDAAVDEVEPEAELEEPVEEPATLGREPEEEVVPVEATPADDEDAVDDAAAPPPAEPEAFAAADEVYEESEAGVDADRSAGADEAVAAIAAAEPAEELAAQPPTSPKGGSDREPLAPDEESTRRSPALLWAVVAVVILVLVGGGYVVYQAMQRAGEAEPAVTQTEQLGPETEPAPDESAVDEAPDEEAGTVEPDAVEPTADEPATEPTPAAPDDPEPEEPEVGLDPEQGGWTIVVASRTSEAAADDVMQEYRGSIADYPVGVFSGTTGGVTRYRIAVGQFESRSEAVQAIEALDDRVPADAWASPLPTDT